MAPPYRLLQAAYRNLLEIWGDQRSKAANCYYPKVKGLVTQANSIYNGQRFEDLWLDN
jgi:hypothetical protein